MQILILFLVNFLFALSTGSSGKEIVKIITSGAKVASSRITRKETIINTLKSTLQHQVKQAAKQLEQAEMKNQRSRGPDLMKILSKPLKNNAGQLNKNL